MNKLKYLLILLVLSSCGESTNEINAKTDNDAEAVAKNLNMEKAQILIDSAMVMSKQGALNEGIALFDEALALDSNSKKVLFSKLASHKQKGENKEVVEILEIIDGSTIKEPYTTLHLGMEYELLGNRDIAEVKYNQAVALFMNVLDTMPITKELKRNTCLMNLALAASLSESNENKQKLENAMSEDEKENLGITLDAIAKTKREKILQIRRQE